MPRLSLTLMLIACLAFGCGRDNDRETTADRAPQSEEFVAPSLPADEPSEEASEAEVPTDELAGPQFATPENVKTPEPLPLFAPGLFTQPRQAPQSALAPSPTTPAAPLPYDVVRVFYGTNRVHSGSLNPKTFYGQGRGDVSYGHCDVSIPRNHQKGKLESPSIWRFEFREDPKKHVVLLGVVEKPQAQFMSELRQVVWNSMKVVDTENGPALAGGEALVFVHGFNNSFEDAARRTAQIAHDLKFQGVPVMYSWPSQEKSSLEAYREDGHMAGWSEEHLIDFVTQVARDSGARKVHLVAHSMGNRIVSGALRRLAEQCATRQIPKFNEVILSAPDIDADYFKTAIAPYITQTADRITIYSSSRDIALKLSSLFNPLARRRLGESGSELTLFPEFNNIDVIDATDVETDLFTLNHSYHASSPTVLNDIQLLLAGYTTEERGLSSMLNHLAWRIRNLGQQLSDRTLGSQSN
ncbi:MAG: alpha/beta fold hydrolase [Planctomycetaceae bacterium]|nr:alpha/beta fold hydrolase [Planctomycetaceae bacterium]